jgi:hypothetical protein
MPTARCSFCGHDNPEASHFCNECGAALHLTLCASCEAINHRAAPRCHKCGASLTAAPTVDADVAMTALASPPVEPIEATQPASRARSWRAAAVLGLLLVAIVGAAIYGIGRTLAVPAPTVANVEISAAPVHEAAEAPAPSSGRATEDAAPQPSTEPTPQTAEVAPGESVSEQGASPPPAVPKRPRRDAKHDAGPPILALMPARSQESTTSPTGRNCTDAVAALGLCNRNHDESTK